MNRTHDAARTRMKILEAAFAEFYRNGFQGGSLNRIVEEAGATKGSLFHHFDGKTALGYAVVDELLRGTMEEEWFKPMRESIDPIAEIKKIVSARREQATSDGTMLCQGCPLNNLAQEMSPLDEEFRKRLGQIYEEWRECLEAALARGIKSGKVRKDISPRNVAALVVAALEGMIGTAKSAQSTEPLMHAGAAFFEYLDSLKR